MRELRSSGEQLCTMELPEQGLSHSSSNQRENASLATMLHEWGRDRLYYLGT